MDERRALTAENLLNSKVKLASDYRQGHGWRLPVTSPHDISFALKAARTPRADDLGTTIAALKAVGREATWVDTAALQEIARCTGSPMKYLQAQLALLNAWLASIDEFVATLGEVEDGKMLRRGTLGYRGGLTTTILLAGDDFGLAPWVLAHALLANARMIVKPSSMEPLSAFLFAKAAAEKGLSIPALIFLDTSSEQDVAAISELVARSSQSVVFGEDRTVETVYRRAAVLPPHRAIPYWSGRSGALVLPDADLRVAAEAIVSGAILDRGNKCISTKKVFAPRALAERFEALLIEAAERLKRGSALDPETDVGTLDSYGRKLAEHAAAAGEIVYDRDFLIARCSEDRSPLLCEEIAYPLLGIRYYDDEDPIALLNATVREVPSRRALNLAVFTNDAAAYRRAAQRLDAFKVLHNASTALIDLASTHQGHHLCLELMRQTEIL